MLRKRSRTYQQIFILLITLHLMAEIAGSADLLSNVNSMTLYPRESKEAATFYLRYRRKLQNRENKENKVFQSRESGNSDRKINFRLKKRDLKNRPKFQITPENYASEAEKQLRRNLPKNISQQISFLSYKTFRKHKRKLNKNRNIINLYFESDALDSSRRQYANERKKRFTLVKNNERNENLRKEEVKKDDRAKERGERSVYSATIQKMKKQNNPKSPSDLISTTKATVVPGTNLTSTILPVLVPGTASVHQIFGQNHPSNDSNSKIKSVQPILPQSGMTLEGDSESSGLDRNLTSKQEKQQRRSLLRSSSQSDESGDVDELPVHKRTSVQYSSLVGPSFVNTTANGRTHALAGQTARLNCIIKNLHNFTVSWIRAGDINLLTSEEVTYSSDNRFVSVNPSKGERWVLKIHHVRLSDAGKYLCQISTSPPISTPVNLIVTEAIAEVFPANEIFLKVGSPVRLICTIHGCPYPALPAWYKGRELQKELIIEESTLTFVPTRTTTTAAAIKHSAPPTVTSQTTSFGGDSLHPFSTFSSKQISPDLVIPLSVASESTTTTSISPVNSHLQSSGPVVKEILVARVIFERPKATLDLSGTYSCTNTCTQPLNLTLHVLIGDEETAAMQHINRAAFSLSSSRDNKAKMILSVLYIYFLAYT